MCNLFFIYGFKHFCPFLFVLSFSLNIVLNLLVLFFFVMFHMVLMSHFCSTVLIEFCVFVLWFYCSFHLWFYFIVLCLVSCVLWFYCLFHFLEFGCVIYFSWIAQFVFTFSLCFVILYYDISYYVHPNLTGLYNIWTWHKETKV
ncbi:hypothetical protein IC582_006060 [Cucumis melo]